MSEIIKNLKNKNLLNENDSDVLFECFGKHANLITNWSKKSLGKKVPKKYSPAIRQFALSLHFFSPKAYQYVRKQFNTVLPHTRTLGKWYSHVDANPGLTNEALKSLTLKATHSKTPIYCSLMFDEMAIRQYLEFCVELSDKETENICLFLDPAHMIKLVRNAFGEKKIFQHKNDYIKFDFIETLFLLLEQEGCHLANKLSKQHIFYFKQKMKIKLATQLLSKSVADALKFCKNKLNIKNFSDVDATVVFIELFNSAFDILNSRSINATGEKKSPFTDPIKVINLSSNNYNGKFDLILSEQDKLENDAVESYINDHDYVCKPNEYTISNFSKEVAIYIAGFVVYKLASALHSDICIKSLCAINKGAFLNSLITMKNKGGDNGGLMYPSDDVLGICYQTEKLLKICNFETRAINTIEIQSNVLGYVLHHRKIFKSLQFHSAESNSPFSDHFVLLIKAISYTYIKLKVNHSLKNHNEKPSLRTWYNKLTLFRGQ
ncbi:hypothetical protein AGLY_017221 [Aphis glycines]|uniref:THAP-type domain-containing protein n=1 Tax=Aphis glycines TaxID=307491 RepID=A0A6G0SVH2_APHGL|nr:hypothetical protein AGLY_017221 [Aphis glycines]